MARWRHISKSQAWQTEQELRDHIFLTNTARERGVAQSYTVSKPAPSEIIPKARPHCLDFLKQFHQNQMFKS